MKNMRIISDPEGQAFETYENRFVCDFCMDIGFGFVVIAFAFFEDMITTSDSVPFLDAVPFLALLQTFSVIAGSLFFLDAYCVHRLRAMLEPVASMDALLKCVDDNFKWHLLLFSLYTLLKLVEVITTLLTSVPGSTVHVTVGIASFLLGLVAIAGKLSKLLVVRAFRRFLLRHHQDNGGQGFGAAGPVRLQSLARGESSSSSSPG